MRTSDDLDFHSQGILTLGVEIELQLINPTDYHLTARAEELLQAAAKLDKVKPEFYLSTVEINTNKCDTVQDIEKDLADTLAAVTPLAEEMGIQFASTGSHPFTRYADCIISPDDRYQSLIDRAQWLTRRMTVYGLHVHLGMKDGEDCIRYNNFFMNFLPHLLALSASSPFWQGDDTGLSACRPTTYESLPTAGQPYLVRNWSEFEQLYESLTRCGSIGSIKDLWWDLRPSPHFGTLELRVCDGPATLEETLAITAFIHGLAHWFQDNGSWMESVYYPPRWTGRENKWRVIRHGLDAELVMTREGKLRPVREDIEEWVERLKPYTVKLGYETYIENLLKIVRQGNSAERQLKVYRDTDSLEEVVKLNIEEFVSQTPRW